MWKKQIITVITLSVALLGFSSLASASTYTITEQQMQILQEGLEKRQSINNQLLAELSELKQELVNSGNKLQNSTEKSVMLQTQLEQSLMKIEKLEMTLIACQVELKNAKSSSMKAETALQEANKSLERYAKQQKIKRASLKLQRNLLALGLIYKIIK